MEIVKKVAVFRYDGCAGGSFNRMMMGLHDTQQQAEEWVKQHGTPCWVSGMVSATFPYYYEVVPVLIDPNQNPQGNNV